MANRKLADNPHISTPLVLSTGPNGNEMLFSRKRQVQIRYKFQLDGLTIVNESTSENLAERVGLNPSEEA